MGSPRPARGREQRFRAAWRDPAEDGRRSPIRQKHNPAGQDVVLGELVEDEVVGVRRRVVATHPQLPQHRVAGGGV